MPRILFLAALLLLPALAVAQPLAAADPAHDPVPAATAPAATAPAATAPAATAPAATMPQTASDDELRRLLRAATEQLARHEAELRELKITLAARPAPVPPPLPSPPAHEAWYERIGIRGYTQVRYNQLPSGVDNSNLTNEQADKSIGGTGGFFIRRARVILFGDVHPRLSIYLQPDFASAISDQLNVSILRDWYADVFLDAKKEFRLRIGQSKVPFGFENMQSSQNRLALDRSDALNSAVKDERDMGVFFYWAPDHIRKRFKYLVDSGLKGSGDFGVIGVGVYNGQGANRFELNRIPHTVVRVTWPFAIGSQFLEIATGGYYGKFNIKLEAAKDGTMYTSTDPDNSFHDTRGHVSVILYPKPFGFIMEYNAGIGPSQGREDPTVITERFLHGGYLQLMYKFDRLLGTVSFIPYVRGVLYSGGKKFFNNAPRYEVREVEMGLEWQLFKSLEIVAAYMISDRTADKYPYKQEYGHVTRLQTQFNF